MGISSTYLDFYDYSYISVYHKSENLLILGLIFEHTQVFFFSGL
ncbi:hypothetical protein D1BOALGB6SA_6603 [Olavius sp. associated proteobacterium Delta 1]|nr:hypothetical protein D1BOALGB6SA_6603 [Olavius sp. associated proteobacterium Delta 1]